MTHEHIQRSLSRGAHEWGVMQRSPNESNEHSACTIHMGAEAKIHSVSVQGTDRREWLGKMSMILRLRRKGSDK